MTRILKQAADTVLDDAVHRAGGVPGVVAMVTDRKGTLYEGAAGVRQRGSEAAMTTDSVMALFSTTQAITGVTLMQLVEEGRLALTDPASEYLSEIDDLEVLTGFGPRGEPRTRPPRREITIADLMLHTSGLGCEFFSEADLKYRAARGIPTVVSCSRASIKTVLLHDPGTQWTYGVSLDWVGRIVEQLRGRRLGEVMREYVFAPLGMQDIGFVLDDAMQARRATLHQRAADGRLTPQPDLVLPQPPELHCGGHGLYGTVGEYMKFIRMVLNDGAGPHGRVLKPDSVAQMAIDGLAPMGLECTGWPTSIPSLSNAGEFFPGIDKGWGYSFMINREATPSGRPAGSLMGAGLANLYCWIDRRHGIGGFWGSQVLPFHDIASYTGFVDFETATYRALMR